jgi:O-acetyl-ADP-ribose deacetylase (regulator of RNase III)
VITISQRWKAPEKQYREWFRSSSRIQLGDVQFVQVEPNLYVANVIGQHGIRSKSSSNPPIRYEAIASGLATLSAFALDHNASVHMPRIGCGLAGGKCEVIEPIIARTLIETGVEVTVYYFVA